VNRRPRRIAGDSHPQFINSARELMNHDSYSFQSNKGDVTICHNDERPSHWDLRIAGKLVRPNYSSAEEAAFLASRRDFGDEELERVYIGLRVPAGLDRWKLAITSQ
jgi:hypothetical protein